MITDILKSVHPVYSASQEEWRRNEARFLAGQDARAELDPFQWEKSTDDSYLERQRKAVCPPLMQQAAERFVGTLFEEPPTYDFGGLGAVRPTTEREGTPTAAELLYDNTDGVGEDASGWDAFWAAEMERATATGFRWILCEAPERRPNSRADEIAGDRPYLVAFSPLAVPDWHFSRGALQYARVVLEDREPRVEGGVFTAEPRKRHLLLVRKDYKGLGPDFEAGGWWLYDADGEPIAGADGEAREGRWDATEGEIPMWRLYYDRDGRGLTDLGSAAVAAMNLLAALYNDALVSGGRKTFFLGVSKQQWDAVASAGLGGGVWVPVPGEEGSKVSVYDTAAATASGAILAALDRILKTAAEVTARELTSAPGASGASKRLELLQGLSPRLASMASNMEEAQNIAIRFAQLRWGVSRPTGGVTWNKRYDLRGLLDKIRDAFALFKEADARSPLLVADLLVRAVEQEGLLSEHASADAVRDEIVESLQEPPGSVLTRPLRRRLDGDLSTLEGRLDAASRELPDGTAGGDGQ